MRPSLFLVIILCSFAFVAGTLFYSAEKRLQQNRVHLRLSAIATSGLGLTDLCIATEARYTRHPAVSDPLAPFGDHIGAIEHFPTGSFWAPPLRHDS